MARLLLIGALLATPALGQVYDCPGMRIIATDLSDMQGTQYCRYAMAERAKVEAFWGPTWTDLIRIRVDERYRISRALVPAYIGNRGYMEMPLQRVTRKNGALLLNPDKSVPPTFVSPCRAICPGPPANSCKTPERELSARANGAPTALARS